RAAIRYVSFRESCSVGAVGDLLLEFFAAGPGGAYYVNEPLSVYRQFAVGSWSLEQDESAQKKLTRFKTVLRNYEQLKKLPDLNSRLSTDLDFAIRRRVMLVAYDPTIALSAKRVVTSQYRRYLGKRASLSVWVACTIPLLPRIMRWAWQ